MKTFRSAALLATAALGAAALSSCQSKPVAYPQYESAYAEGDTLRKYAEHAGLFFGCVVRLSRTLVQEDRALGDLVGREFNLLGPDSYIWRTTEPSEGVFDFSILEEDEAFARSRGMKLSGFVGPWHVLNADWLQDKTFAELGPILRRHVERQVGWNQGSIKLWQAFNEIVNDDGNGYRNRQYTGEHQFVRSLWVDGNDLSLIVEAFKTARRANPGAFLYLNEFFNEEWESSIRTQSVDKGKFFYETVLRLRKEGMPIDGVGFQLSGLSYPQVDSWGSDLRDLDRYIKNVDANVKRYAAQGLSVVFSEVAASIKLSDLDLSTEKGEKEYKRRQDFQARVYEGLVRIALDNRNVVAFIIFGTSDKYWDTSNSPKGSGKPFLWDENLKPKPAYYALLKALKEKAASEGPQEPRVKL
jgi:endo-1,4-beta-xylanase